MENISCLGDRISKACLYSRVLMTGWLTLVLSFGINAANEQVDATDYDEAPVNVEEEVNTNDPTAAAISFSAGWEINDWYEDEIAPGTPRPPGSDNNFNTRFVIPMAKGTWGSPWPVINRFSFSNV